MAQKTALYHDLNRHWKSLCRVLFGEEVGELEEFEGWLAENIRPIFHRKSKVSGKNVSMVLPYYSQEAPTVSLDEVDFERKFEPLSINQVKDIDSIVEALGERLFYAGNIQLGNSRFVEGSSDVMDSFYVYDSAQISYSKYVAYGYSMEYAENAFGTMYHGHCSHCIAISDADYLTRCVEVSTSEESQDCFYSHRLFRCRNCIFCFNLWNRSNSIGNLSLPPDKFASLKKKLLSEMAGELRKEKKLPSLIELVGNSKPDAILVERGRGAQKPNLKKDENPEPVVKAFGKTTGVLFGKELGNPEQYGKWLSECIRTKKPAKSALSGSDIVVVDQANYFKYPQNRLATFEEAYLLGEKLVAPQEEVDKASLRGEGILEDVAIFCPNITFGECSNLIDSYCNISSVNCLHSNLNLYSKNCGYNYYLHTCESVFGCNCVRHSNFLLRCYMSGRLARCFEVDASVECTDSYYCHNCQNVRDSMFCFNAKNLKNAVGNAQFPREDYVKIKKNVQQELLGMLEKENRIGLSIFNLSERRR